MFDERKVLARKTYWWGRRRRGRGGGGEGEKKGGRGRGAGVLTTIPFSVPTSISFSFEEMDG